MFPAVMQAPLSSEATDLYLWATVSAACAHFGRDVDEMWRSLDARPVRDSDVIERGGRLWHDYQRLAHEIRRKVIAAQTARERQAKGEFPNQDPALRPAAPIPAKKATHPSPAQMSMFEGG